MNAEKHPDMVKALMSFNSTNIVWCLLYVVLIFFFNYFYVSIQYDAVEMANNLRMNGGTIPGRRPGKPTSEFIAKAMNQIAGTGSVALTLIAVAPIVAQGITGVYMPLSGTSLLIVVGVATELVIDARPAIVLVFTGNQYSVIFAGKCTDWLHFAIFRISLFPIKACLH